jgi:hypothetical protein
VSDQDLVGLSLGGTDYELGERKVADLGGGFQALLDVGLDPEI